MFDLCDFSSISVDEEMTVDELYSAWGIAHVRMYLTSKRHQESESEGLHLFNIDCSALALRP